MNNIGIDQLLWKVIFLKESIKEKKTEIAENFAVRNLFTHKIKGYELHLQQLKKVIVYSELKEKVAYTQKKIEKLKQKFHGSEVRSRTPEDMLFDVASKFRQHQMAEAFEEFEKLEKKHPEVAKKVFGELWQLKGKHNHDRDYGKMAFYGRCFPCLNRERAEALHFFEFEWKLGAIIDCFAEEEHDWRKEAYSLFRDFEEAHPLIAITLFWKVWTLYGSPGPNSPLFRPDFGRDVFYGEHPGVEYDPKLIVKAMRDCLPGLCENALDSKFTEKEDQLRYKKRFDQVMLETRAILCKGSYLSAAGKKQSLDFVFDQQNKAGYSPKILFEARAQSCIAAAYDLVAHGRNPLILNEQELLPCTTLSLVQKSIYTRNVILFRMGAELDYQLCEEPVSFAVATLEMRDIENGRTLLKTAFENGHDSLVLKTSEKMATVLMELAQNEFKGRLKQIVFVAQENFQSLVQAIHFNLGDSYGPSGELLCK